MLEKHQLAQELRQRQYNLGTLERRLIDEIPDDEIIDSYITCSCCGEKQVTPQALETAIGFAANVDQFADFCESFARARSAALASTRTVRKAKARRRR